MPASQLMTSGEQRENPERALGYSQQSRGSSQARASSQPDSMDQRHQEDLDNVDLLSQSHFHM